MLPEYMMIVVSQLRAFTAVVEVGTTVGAASAIRLTQPRVSRLITELEAEVGFRLFEREGRRLILSRRGARLYDEVKHALDSFDNVRQAAERIRGDMESEIRILAPPYIAHTLLPVVLARFRERFPARKFSVEIVVRNAMGAWLPYRQFDVGIAALPFELPTVHVRPFTSLETLVVMPKGHPLSKKRKITLADIALHPFVSPNRNAAIRKRLDAIFERDGIQLMIIGDTTNSNSACEMVAEGLGVTILDALVPLTNKSKLIEVRRWSPGMRTDFGLIYPSGNSLSPAVEMFSEITKTVIHDIASTYESPVRR